MRHKNTQRSWPWNLLIAFSCAAVLCFALVTRSDGSKPDIQVVDRYEPLQKAIERMADVQEVHTNTVSAMHGRVQEVLDRLDKMEQAIRALDKPAGEPAPAPAVEPEPEPIVGPDPAVVPIVPEADPEPAGAAEARRILQQYKGQGWYVVGARGDKARLIQHMAEHGMDTDGLDQLSYAELEKVHGACHTQHKSARHYARGPGDSRFKSGAGRQPYQQKPFQRQRVYRYQNCPTGRCPTRR